MNKINSVLLIDDDEATNFINELVISRSNITKHLLQAKNGKEAIEILADRCADQQSGKPVILPELILLDLNMPVMDGFGFLQAFEALNCPGKEHVKIAVLTTSLHPKDAAKVQQAGISDFLNKPLTKDSLQTLLNKHFN